MFTGIIEGFGTIVGIRSAGGAKQLTIAADFDLSGTRIGDSIAVSGACLTVIERRDRQFRADVSPETLLRTTFDKCAVGERVNLERALRLGDRLDGHLVSGHIDGTGVIEEKSRRANAIRVLIGADPALCRYMIAKGSVAVDGISLTLNACMEDRFSVTVIPHTAKLTTIGLKRERDAVNIETDMIGKYVERFTSGAKDQGHKNGGVDLDFLHKTGFI